MLLRDLIEKLVMLNEKLPGLPEVKVVSAFDVNLAVKKLEVQSNPDGTFVALIYIDAMGTINEMLNQTTLIDGDLVPTATPPTVSVPTTGHLNNCYLCKVRPTTSFCDVCHLPVCVEDSLRVKTMVPSAVPVLGFTMMSVTCTPCAQQGLALQGVDIG